MNKYLFEEKPIQSVYTTRISIDATEYFKYYTDPHQKLSRILYSDERFLWRRVWYDGSTKPSSEIRVTFKCKREHAYELVRKFRNSIFPVPLKSVFFL